MKTKHLLFAAALPLVFAACSNEEFGSLNNSPELSSDQRPLVDVKLDFQKGEANTRVDYDGSTYKWQTTDKIGAFLMDEMVSTNRPFGSTADAWKGETWLEHYKLVDYIHTDYPFSWNETNNAWEAPSKLQEGNYFFACPYDSYEGQRQLIHKIDGQSQTGGTVTDMNAAIAKNQYFIGYAQVKAGTENKEALKSVVMTPTLAPIKVTLRNIGTLAKDVEKIIVYGDQVATALTVNPTDAKYGGTKADGTITDAQTYNLGSASASVGSTDIFNYANVIDAKEDVHTVAGDILVYNIASGATDYSKADALRQIVHPSYSKAAAQAPAYEKQAVLSFSKPINVAGNGGEIHFAVMVNTIPTVTADELSMDIVTKQGQITKINLTKKKEAEANNPGTLDPNTVLTNIEIKSLKPGTKNELIIQFDNNSVVKAQEKDVQDDTELLAFINWNAENVRVNTATLLKDVKFTKEMYDAIKATSYKGSLAVAGTGKLLVDDNVPVDVLDELDEASTATVVLKGARTMTKELADALENAKLTIENQGVLTIAEEVVANVKINNYGTIKVTETGELKGTAGNDKVYNYGILENLGKIYNVNNAVDGEAKGLIKTSALVNHITSNAAGATIQLTKVTDPLSVATQSGTVYLETAEGVTAEGLNEKKVTKLNVTGGTIDFNDADITTVKELIINGTVALEGWDKSSPRKSTYHEFTGVEKASIDGAVSFKNAGIVGSSATTVEKNAKLTFAEGVAEFNDITFIKGATVNVLEKGTVTVAALVWNGNTLNNLGSFKYASTTGTVNVIAGNDPEKITTPPTVTTVTFDVVVNSAAASDPSVAPTDKGTYTVKNLKQLNDFMTKAQGAPAWAVDTDYKIGTTITISSELTLSAETDKASYGVNHFSYLKEHAAGKEVKLGEDLIGLTNIMGMSFKTLTVTANATVSSTSANVVTLTVENLAYNAVLTITDGYIKITGDGQIGTGSTKVTGTGSIGTSTGKIVTSKTGEAGTLIQWDGTNNVWKAI